MRALARVGQAVNFAIERFVTVGETIADDNPEIKCEMYEACKDARAAGMCKPASVKVRRRGPFFGYVNAVFYFRR